MITETIKYSINPKILRSIDDSIAKDRIYMLKAIIKYVNYNRNGFTKAWLKGVNKHTLSRILKGEKECF